MAIGIFNSLSFGGINSADYGVYISGSGVYNAPERAVESVSVPGRNGALLLDKGHFENIEIEYPAGTFGTEQEGLSDKLSAFRNALKAQIGYQRLTDTYHPDEYRLGVFVDAFEVDPVNNNSAGEFKLIFNCKPQRFLTSGETEVDLPNNTNTVVNPTLFDSKPLIKSVGYGDIVISSDNGDEYVITLEDDTVGELELVPAFTSTEYHNVTNARSEIRRFDPYGMLVGTNDTMDLPEFTFIFTLQAATGYTLSSLTIGYPNGHTIPNYIDTTYERLDAQTIRAVLSYGAQSFANDWSYTHLDDSLRLLYTINDGTDSTTFTQNFTLSVGVDNDSNARDQYLAFRVTNFSATKLKITKDYTMQFTSGALTCDSTASVLGNPTYIDCEIGEVYKELGDMVVSLNRYVSLGSDLPVLVPGENSIDKRSGYWSSLKVVPRWWII